MVLASVAYAAPETLAGKGVDHRADVYSLGCSLYRMLTAKTPFAGLAWPWPTSPSPRRGTIIVAGRDRRPDRQSDQPNSPPPATKQRMSSADAAREALIETQSTPVKFAQPHHPVTSSHQGHQPPGSATSTAPSQPGRQHLPSAYYIAHPIGDSAASGPVTPSGVRGCETKSLSHAHGTTDIKSRREPSPRWDPGNRD